MSTRKRILSTEVDDNLVVTLTIGFGRSSFDACSVNLREGKLSDFYVRGFRDPEALASLQAKVPCTDAYRVIFDFLADLYSKVDSAGEAYAPKPKKKTLER